jgi:flavin-dependent dehydrogenase
MGNSFDVAVIGAGPAGSIAALSLARAGVCVALLEKRDIPREKVCGDVLMPDAIDLLRQYGLWDELRAQGHTLESARVFAPDGSCVDLAGTFHAIRRLDLDAFLANKAVEAGATLISGAEATGHEAGPDGAFDADTRATTTATPSIPRGPGPTPTLTTPSTSRGANPTPGTARVAYLRNGDRRELNVRLAILACGASAKTLRRFGVLVRETPSAFAMRAYYRLRDDVDDARLHFFFERAVLPGYGWIFPMGDGVFNIGVGIYRDAGTKRQNLRHVLTGFLTQCEVPRDMTREGTLLAPFKGAPMRTALAGARPSTDRLLACGEAIGATYSMTGEGIGKAMQTASLAADHALAALRSGKTTAQDLGRYDRELERAFRQRFDSYKTAQKWLGRPAVANFMVRRARYSPRARGILEGIIAERAEPTELFSFWGIVKAMLLN